MWYRVYERSSPELRGLWPRFPPQNTAIICGPMRMLTPPSGLGCRSEVSQVIGVSITSPSRHRPTPLHLVLSASQSSCPMLRLPRVSALPRSLNWQLCTVRPDPCAAPARPLSPASSLSVHLQLLLLRSSDPSLSTASLCFLCPRRSAMFSVCSSRSHRSHRSHRSGVKLTTKLHCPLPLKFLLAAVCMLSSVEATESSTPVALSKEEAVAQFRAYTEEVAAEFKEDLGAGTWKTLAVGKRSIDAYTPACAATAPNSVELVISLHAWAQTANAMKKLDRFAALADRECFVVAYPQGLRRAASLFGLMGYSWNAGGCCPKASEEEVDDVAYIAESVQVLRSSYSRLVRDRAFHVGMSNGGMMVNRLACELPADLLTAIASVSGPLVNGTGAVGEPFACRSAVPILHMHGDADSVVPFGGCNATWTSYGKLCIWLHDMGLQLAAFPPILDYVAAWRVRNGVLDAPPVTSFSNGTVTCTAWAPRTRQQANVTLCVVGGEGHAWPGMRPQAACRMPGFHCNNDMDATAEIWAFFRGIAATHNGSTYHPSTHHRTSYYRHHMMIESPTKLPAGRAAVWGSAAVVLVCGILWIRHRSHLPPMV